jgi:hypothetical protein
MEREPTRVVRQEQLNAIRADEAVALFQANQAGRNAIERVVGLFLSVGAIAGTTAAATSSPDAVLPLPAFLFLLFSYMFQQYTDLTVLGRARLRLESLVNTDLDARALIYETTIAEIRQRYPLSWSVRMLQSLLGLVALGATAGATIVAIRSADTWILIGYVAGTALALASALFSYVHMLKSPSIADDQLEREELGSEQALWVSPELHEKVLKQVRRGEVPRETAERLLEKALASDV